MGFGLVLYLDYNTFGSPIVVRSFLSRFPWYRSEDLSDDVFPFFRSCHRWSNSHCLKGRGPDPNIPVWTLNVRTRVLIFRKEKEGDRGSRE